MEFDKVRFDGANVELEYQEPIENGGKRDVGVHGKDPTPAFKSSLQAFAGYVCWIHSLPEDAVDRIDVRGVTIKRPDDAPRGIVVTALLKCPRARNSTSTLNTPFLHEKSADQPVTVEAPSGFLPAHVPALVDQLEEHAKAYIEGARGEQTQLPLDDTNANNVADRMSAESASATRKGGRKTKGPQLVHAGTGGVIPVVNEPGEPLTDESLRAKLRQADRDVSLEAIATWTSTERQKAAEWAAAAGDTFTMPQDVPPEPEWVRKHADPALNVPGWNEPAPAKPSDEVVHDLQDIARRGD